MFNTTATALAIGAYAIWEQDIAVDHPKTKDTVNFFFPFLYKYSRDEEIFTLKKFLVWSVLSVL